jgi:hypothetical protein
MQLELSARSRFVPVEPVGDIPLAIPVDPLEMADASPVAAEMIPQAIPVEPGIHAERRGAVRHPCHREAWLTPVTLLKGQPWHSIVLDISTTGIGLAIERPVPTGTFFAIEITDLLEGKTWMMRARVLHSTPQGHGYWRIGCIFETKVSPADIEALA